MRVTATHIYFWGSIYSNWYMCPVEYEGHKFSNSEQAFMWAKAIHFEDYDTADEILKEPTPALCKDLGRQVKNFNKAEWDFVCDKYMDDVNLCKFEQNIKLGNQLLETNNKTIVEASPMDRIWGIGLHEDNDDVLDESKWRGTNRLGKSLMRVRTILKQKRNTN